MLHVRHSGIRGYAASCARVSLVSAGIAGGSLCAAAWSADGARLYAGGRYQSDGALPVVIWQEEGRGPRSQAPLAQNTVMQLLLCGDGVAE